MKKIIFLLTFIATMVYSQTSYRFNINNINLPIDNKGILAAVNIPPDGPNGRFGSSTFLFSSGFMISGLNLHSLWACGQASSMLVENFIPGNVDSNQTNPIYKIYVNDNSITPNYAQWQDYINAVNSGADFYDGDGDGIYNPIDLNGNNQWDPNEDKPDIIGDKMTWCVFNDGVPGDQRIRFVNVDPVGLEIHQSLFGYASTDLLGNVIFIRYVLRNVGKVNSKFDSVYFSTWADPDLGVNYMDDLVGSDTLRNSGFVYNSAGNDPGYGAALPSYFIKFLEGPRSYIPGETFVDNNSTGTYDEGIDTPLDTAYSRRGKDLGVEIFPGAKNVLMNSIVHFQSSDSMRGDPSNAIEVSNYMQGKLKPGNWLDPCIDNRGQVTGGVNCADVNPLYWYSGDPVSNIGWLNTIPTDQRIMINSGPFDLEFGKPVSIIIAYIVGQGTNRLESITKAREIAEYVHNFYLSNFGEFPVGVYEDPISQIPTDFRLEQNYPNPFNPSTKIIWQSPVSSHQTLKVYDVLGNEVATLVDEFRPAGIYEIEFNVARDSRPAITSGVYFYQLKAGNYIETKKMLLLK